MRNLLVLLVAFITSTAVSCSSREPAERAVAVRSGQALISDQAHNSGTKGFLFLPPLVPQPRITGVFEARLSPEVLVDRIDPGTGTSLQNVARFTATTRVNGERLRRYPRRGFYMVRWHTVRYALDPASTYRIRVLVGGQQLGFADVDVTATRRELRNVHTNEFVPLKNGDVLPIKFRIEAPAVDKDGDGVFDWGDNCPTVANPPVSATADPLPSTTDPPSGCDYEAEECDPEEQDCNPPVVAQTDTDGDGVGDACECLGVECPDPGECQEDVTCDPTTGECTANAQVDGTACDDGDACTGTDACAAGVCTGSDPVICVAQDQCHVPGTCDASTGQCSSPPAPDGAICDDGDACTTGDSCRTGACLATSTIACSSADACRSAGVCNPVTGQCASAPLLDDPTCEFDEPPPLIRPGRILGWAQAEATSDAGATVRWEASLDRDLPAGTLFVPPGAVDSPVKVGVVVYDGGPEREQGALYYELLPQGLQLARPALLTIGYRESWVTANAVDESGITAAHIFGGPPEDVERLVPQELDPNSDYAQFSVDHFSIVSPVTEPVYGLMLKKTVINANGDFWNPTDGHIKVIMVHGLELFGPSDEFGTFGDVLKQTLAGTGRDAGVAYFDYPTGRSIDANARRLAYIVKAHDGFQGTFVAHSMGGLVVRAALQLHGLGPYVRHLITLGTPHEGAPLARCDMDTVDYGMEFACNLGRTLGDGAAPGLLPFVRDAILPGVRDLSPTSGLIAALSVAPSAGEGGGKWGQQGVPYFTLWTPNDAWLPFGCDADACGEGRTPVVPDDSEQGANVLSKAGSRELDFNCCGVRTHTEFLYANPDDPSLVPEQIKEWICAFPNGLDLPDCPQPTESCNFVDDNGDGQVDEGLAWTAGPWTWLFSTRYFGAYLKGILLRDGRIALAGGDSQGGGSDRGYLAIVSSAGRVLAGPVWTPMPATGLDVVGVAEGPFGQIAASYSGTSYGVCPGCGPVVLVRVNGGDLSPVGSAIVDLPFPMNTTLDLAGTGTAYVLLSRERPTGVAHLTWVDPQTGDVTADLPLPGQNVASASLAYGDGGLGWILGRLPTPGPIEFGFTESTESPGATIGPVALSASNGLGVYLDGGGRGVVSSGDSFYAGFNVGPSATSEPQIVRLSGATVAAGPSSTGAMGTLAKDIALVGGNVVAMTVSQSPPYTIRLRRLRADLRELEPVVPETTLSSPESGYLTAVGTSDGVLVFRGRSGRVEAAHIGCAE